VAAGKMRLPEVPLDADELWKIKTGRVEGSDAIAALLQDRNEGDLCIASERQPAVGGSSHVVSATACSTKIHFRRSTSL
ncbi:MAG: hypothetical protein WA510_00040, partial [Acidobacteriaceae bacterium]